MYSCTKIATKKWMSLQFGQQEKAQRDEEGRQQHPHQQELQWP